MKKLLLFLFIILMPFMVVSCKKNNDVIINNNTINGNNGSQDNEGNQNQQDVPLEFEIALEGNVVQVYQFDQINFTTSINKELNVTLSSSNVGVVIEDNKVTFMESGSFDITGFVVYEGETYTRSIHVNVLPVDYSYELTKNTFEEGEEIALSDLFIHHFESIPSDTELTYEFSMPSWS